jgi:ABC-type amino acid transport substrate-binding protein
MEREALRRPGLTLAIALVVVLGTTALGAGCGDDGGGSDIKSVADLKGKIVGAQKGTTGADYAKDKTDAKTVRTYAEIDDAFNALQAGQVDAVVNDFPVSKYAEQRKKNLKVVETIPTGEKYGLAFAKDAGPLREQANGALAEMKQDGTYEKIYEKWFEQPPPKSILKVEDKGSAPTGGQLETISSGKLTVGSDIPYEPFEFGKAPDYEGFDIDIDNEVAKRLDLDLEVKDTSFDTIFRDLAQGKFDMVSSATTITPEREKEVSFSEPYFPADQSIMVKVK